MKLKTLKDFGEEGAIINGKQFKSYSNFDLRQESIKWITHYRNAIKFALLGKDEDGHDMSKYSGNLNFHISDNIRIYESQLRFIMFFFNITEKELNDE